MNDFLVPIIVEENVSLFRVVFNSLNYSESEQKNTTGHESLWDIPNIAGSDKRKGGFTQNFEVIYENIERYLTNNFKNTTPSQFSIRMPKELKEKLKQHPKISDETVSILLGIFLAAANELMNWKVRNCWQSITSTGTFENTEPISNENLRLKEIGLYEDKFKKGFLEDIVKFEREPKKRHLFIYISNDYSLEEYNSSEGIFHVKAFSPQKNTLFDILDYIFELPLLFSLNSDNMEQEKYFNDFTDKTHYICKKNIINAPFYHDNRYSSFLEKGSLFIYGPSGCGKSFLAKEIARRLVWDKNIFAPVWIDINNDILTEAGLVPKIIDSKNDNDLFGLPNEIQDEIKRLINYIDEKSFIEMISNKKFLFIIDGFDLPDRLLDDYILKMKKFIKIIENKGSRVIFTSTQKYDYNYDNLRPEYMPSFSEEDVKIFCKENLFGKKAESEDFNDLITPVIKYYGNFPHLLEILSTQLINNNCNNLLNQINIECYEHMELTVKAAICYRNIVENPDPHGQINEKIQFILLYLLNFSSDSFVEIEKIKKDIDVILFVNKENKNAGEIEEVNNNLKDIFNSSYFQHILEILTNLKLILQKDEKIKIYNKLTHKILMFGDFPAVNEKRKKLVSEKRMLNNIIYHYLIWKVDNTVNKDIQEKPLKSMLENIKKGQYEMDLKGECNILHGIARWCPNEYIAEIIMDIYPELIMYVNKNGEPEFTVDRREQTILHYAAASNNNTQIIALILKKIKKYGINEYLSYINKNGNNVLHYAAEFNSNQNIAGQLLSNEEMTQDIIDHKNSEGFTPIMYFCWFSSNIEIIEKMLKGFYNRDIFLKSDIDIKANNNVNILHCLFAPNGKTELIEKKIRLIKQYSGNNFFKMFFNEKDSDRQCTPFQYAITHFFDASGILEFFVEIETEINKYDENGWTPVHYAVMLGNYELVRRLAELKANLNISDKQEFTPLHLAVETGKQSEFIELLATPENINKKTNQYFFRSTPLHLALNLSEPSRADKKMQVMNETVRCLIKHKADIEKIDDMENTPLHYAVGFNAELEIIKLLINKNTINKINHDGLSPLAVAHEFSASGEIIDLLINNGAKF